MIATYKAGDDVVTLEGNGGDNNRLDPEEVEHKTVLMHKNGNTSGLDISYDSGRAFQAISSYNGAIVDNFIDTPGNNKNSRDYLGIQKLEKQFEDEFAKSFTPTVEANTGNQVNYKRIEELKKQYAPLFGLEDKTEKVKKPKPKN
jgi:hypothetical protein